MSGRLTPAQTKLLNLAASSPGRQIVCPANPAGELGRKLTIDGRDQVGRLRVQNARATAWALLDRNRLRRVRGEADVYEVVS